jgi:gluconate:H+ symporter, GntP family
VPAISPLLVLFLAIAAIFVLIMRFRVNAFIALVLAAILVGVLSPRVALPDVMPTVVKVFGDVAGRIAIVIAMAAIIGVCLMESGAADKITRVFVRLLGEARASLSLLVSGFVLAAPVFFDTVFYLLVPLARAMRIRTGAHYLLFVMAVVSGAAVTHTMAPPTPGPLAAAVTLNVDLGLMIIVGVLIGIPMSMAGWLFSLWLDRRMPVPLREAPGMSLAELQEVAHSDEGRLPSFLSSLLPIGLPVILITCNTIAGAIAPQSGLRRVTAFFGDPNFALLLAAFVALRLLAVQRKYTLGQLAKPVESALASAGIIILITAAGGAFGGMLVQAGVGETLGGLAQQYDVPLLMLGFLLAALLKIAQGSGTVAIITASSILAPLVIQTAPPYHSVYIVCAIGCGSLVGSWMNDSGFWVYKQMSGFTEAETLKTWTPLLAVLGIAGLLATYTAAMLVPLR